MKKIKILLFLSLCVSAQSLICSFFEPRPGISQGPNNHATIIQLLLDINAKSRQACQELFFQAVKNGDVEQVKKLMPSVDCNARTEYNNTALLLSASQSFRDSKAKKYDIIAYNLLALTTLLVNAKNVSGRTALMQAAFYGRESLVQLLLEHHAIDISVIDQYGDNALSLAAGYPRIVTLLLFKQKSNEKKALEAYSPAVPAQPAIKLPGSVSNDSQQQAPKKAKKLNNYAVTFSVTPNPEVIDTNKKNKARSCVIL